MSDVEMNRHSSSNASMVNELQNSGVLRSPDCINAFLAADRGRFWVQDDERGGSADLIYADMPLRKGLLHLSAPHIYAKAVESFKPFRRGMSFLNVGSGTGYFNSIIGELIGPASTNHGIDIWPDVIEHARQRCNDRAGGSSNIEFTLGNVYELDVPESWDGATTRYDRIYLGACANSRSKYLYRLLEVGGILIGPFQTGHAQQLRRVTRHTEEQFNVEVLGSVHFASLVEPVPAPSLPPAESESESASAIARTRAMLLAADQAQQSALARFKRTAVGGRGRRGSSTDSEAPAASPGLPGVPFTLYLSEKPWSQERCWMFPASYKQAVRMTLSCRPRNHTLPCIPTELWIEHIFPWCSKHWFDLAEQPKSTIGPFSPLSRSSAGLSELSRSAFALPAVSPMAKRAKSDDEVSDDGTSTHAPSSGLSSAQTTPDNTPPNGPSSPPMDIDMMEDSPTPQRAAQRELELFEFFENGFRHTIGAPNDPDDHHVPIDLTRWRRQHYWVEAPRQAWEEETIEENDEEENDDDADAQEDGDDEEHADYDWQNEETDTLDEHDGSDDPEHELANDSDAEDVIMEDSLDMGLGDLP